MSTDQLSPLVADLHLLTVLASTKSFTETARRLGVSKASASMRISELERVAGVLLVRRTTRSVGLTEAGQQMVSGMQPAFDRIVESYTAARDLVGTPRGLVRLTAPVALGRQHLAPRIATFLKRFPDIHIELELTDRFVNLANEGFDLAVRHTSAPPETHVAWVLCDTRSVLVASADYLQRRGVPAHPSELVAHDCLLYLGDHAGSWTFARNTKRKSAERVGVNITGSLKANNSEVLRDALLAGLGIGLLPDFSLGNKAPTLFTSCNALPPGGALRLRPGKAGSAAPAGEDEASTLFSSCKAQPPGGAAGRGSEPANAGSDGTQMGGVSPPGGLQGLRMRPGKAGSAAPAREDEVSTLFSSPLVQVLPDWQVQGFFGERIYALRPWSPQVPKAVQCLVAHLRESFAGGFAT